MLQDFDKEVADGRLKPLTKEQREALGKSWYIELLRVKHDAKTQIKKKIKYELEEGNIGYHIKPFEKSVVDQEKLIKFIDNL